MSPVRNLSSNIATTGSSLKVKGSTSKLLAGSEQEDIRHTIAQVGISTWRCNYLLPLLIEARQMVLSQILFSHSLERKDVILRAAQMEQIVEKSAGIGSYRFNTAVSKISVYFYEQFQFFKGWKLTNTVCFTSRS
ncbi:hypothetical protein Bca4012_097595 [Brassica carinata]|uniref:Uncharacterized protein n=1 Tax=Brassica carinata TaxID=52824 RepID=A0A8X7TQV9_BRACI|nr:hypothetical protein Bca52824_080352 [Brassica carinata]